MWKFLEEDYEKRFGTDEAPSEKYAFWLWLRDRANLKWVSRLAIILLTATVQSASCERLFSNYGLVKNKQRNRLSTDVMKQLVTLKHSLRQKLVTATGKSDMRSKLMSPAEYERANQRLPDSGEDLSSGSSVHFKPISAVGPLCEERVDKESVASQYDDSEDSDTESETEQEEADKNLDKTVQETWEAAFGLKAEEQDQEARTNSVVQQNLNTGILQPLSGEISDVEFSSDTFFGNIVRENHRIDNNSAKEELESCGLRSFKISLAELYKAWVTVAPYATLVESSMPSPTQH